MKKLRALLPSPKSIFLVFAIGALGLLAVPSLTMAGPGELTPVPSQVDFGPQDIHNGQSGFRQVRLENLTGAEVTVSAVETVGADAAHFSSNTNCGFLNDGESCEINVSFDPGTTGEKAAQLEVISNVAPILIPLTGTGATGTLSGSSPSFNSQPFFYGGQQQNANIANNSSFAAEATTATITGPDAAFFSIGYSGCQFVLYPGNNCSVGVNFNPTGPGTKTAQLELSNDGTINPLVIPLSATALAGPKAVLTPPERDFGDVALGSASPPQVFSVANAGDFPLQVQQLLVISGAPQLFPLSGDSCSQQILAPGASCQFTERFQPTLAGPREATVFVITNQSGPVVTAALSGAGVPSPRGHVTVAGTEAAGSWLTCIPHGYSDGTRFSYQWLRNGQPVAGATGVRFLPVDADVGSRLACRIEATNSVGSETAVSPTGPPIAARLLSKLEGSLVGSSVCRVVQAPARLQLGGRVVKLSSENPVTPEATLRLDAPGLRMEARIDGRPVARGTGRVTLTPRSLQGFRDGGHTLRVESSSVEASVGIALAPCRLAVRLEGGPKRSTKTTVSASAGMMGSLIRLPRGLRIHVAKATSATVSVSIAGQATQTFSLNGARTGSNGIVVFLRSHAIEVRHLPPEAGVVSVELSPGTVTGRGGTVRAMTMLRGDRGPSSARARVIWRP